MAWVYEADESPKVKHHWNHAYPGLAVGRGGETVGKCPNDLTLAELEDMLNTGVEWRPAGWSQAHPHRIYAVRDGWLYQARPTRPGISYHGFPEIEGRVKPALRPVILAEARARGCEKAIKRYWP